MERQQILATPALWPSTRRVSLKPTILATGNAMTAMTTNSADQSRPQPRVVALRAGKAVFL